MGELHPPHVIQPGGVRPPQPQAPAPPKITPIGGAGPKPAESSSDPISLIDEPKAGTAPAPSKIKLMGSVAQTHATYKRQSVCNNLGAIRVRSFHGRLSEEGLQYLDDKINEWLDGHPDIEVKTVTSTIGVFEGKIREPALILNIWY